MGTLCNLVVGDNDTHLPDYLHLFGIQEQTNQVYTTKLYPLVRGTQLLVVVSDNYKPIQYN